jgi:V8-like Glu-specific endopeptidase
MPIQNFAVSRDSANADSPVLTATIETSRRVRRTDLFALAAVAAVSLLTAARPAAAQAQDKALGPIRIQTGTQIQTPAGKNPNSGGAAPVTAPPVNPGAFTHSLGSYKPLQDDVEVVHEVASGRTIVNQAGARTAIDRAASGALFDQDLGSNGAAGKSAFAETFPELSAQAGRGPAMSPPMDPNGSAGGGPAASSRMIFGSDNRIQITNTTYFPWRAQCRLLMRYPNGAWAQGSGTLIGYKYVITAGHCVYSAANGGWATNVYIYPGQNGGYLPYSYATATYLRSVTGWTSSGSSDYDYGLITCNWNVGYSTGWFGLASFSDSTLGSMTGNISGYPGEKPYATQWYGWGPIQDKDSTMVYYYIDSTPGDRGAGVYVIYGGSRYVFAVHTGWSWHFNWFNSGDYNHGTRINSTRYYQILGWMNSGY